MFEEIIFLLFIFIKQFYFKQAGKFQIADFILLILFLIICFKSIKNKEFINTLKRDFYIYLFIFICISINLIYFLIYQSPDFIKYSAYWLYSAAVIFSFRSIKSENLKHKLTFICLLCLISQTIIYFLGIGRVFIEKWGAIRHMGSFTDPNQLGFFIMCCMFVIYLDNKVRHKPIYYISLLLSVFLILKSKSTGAFIGLFSLIFLDIILFILYKIKNSKNPRKNMAILGSTIIIFVIILIFIFTPKKDFDIANVDYNIVTRIQFKLSKIFDDGIMGLFVDRSADRMLLYPYYNIFGAGEGYLARFPLAATVNEIHVTLFSILFCYGIIPTLLFLYWVFINNKNINKYQIVILISLFLESMTLINYRQPFFWIILIYSSNKLLTKHNN